MCATEPSGRTTSAPMTWFVVKPYFKQCTPPEYEGHPRLDRQRTAGEAGAGAAGDERYTLFIAGLHYPLDVLGRLRQDDEVRDDPVVHEAVALIGAELLALGDHPLRTEDRLHRPYEPVPLHVCLPSRRPSSPLRPSPSMIREPGKRTAVCGTHQILPQFYPKAGS